MGHRGQPGGGSDEQSGDGCGVQRVEGNSGRCYGVHLAKRGGLHQSMCGRQRLVRTGGRKGWP